MVKFFCISFITACLLLVSCKGNEENTSPYSDLSAEYFDSIATDSYRTNSAKVMDALMMMIRNDRDSLVADVRTRGFYKQNAGNRNTFLWINRHGVSSQADSLVACLDSCEADGFNKDKFRLKQIVADIECVRNFNFDSITTNENVNAVLARLEYNLTKAFLRYAVGQRYGFVNPKEATSKLDVRDSDSVRVTYRQLFDIPIHVAGKSTYADAIEHIRRDSVGWYLREAQPNNKIYIELKRLLKNNDRGFSQEKILINMERARWRTKDFPDMHDEYVIVNIPSYHLWALRDNKVSIDMRIGCGSKKTKTPLLYSEIKRMDINPQWVVPWSVRTKELSHHSGNGAYFDGNHFYASNKKTGDKVYGCDITWSIINSSDWNIIQKGGVGNSLGRIIFRFDNNFAVYLHDTNHKSVFEQNNRSVSHGCIRVEHPFELAAYMMRGKDENLLDKVRYSMETDINSKDSDKSKLVYSINVEPKIPIYIMYYTLFPVPNGEVQSFPDVYGYDSVIEKELKRI